MILVSLTNCSDGCILRRYDTTLDRGLTHVGAWRKDVSEPLDTEDVEAFRRFPPKQMAV